MLKYFLIFSLLGFVAEKALPDKASIGVVALIALFWMAGHGIFWGLVSGGEMMLGYAAAKFMFTDQKSKLGE